MFFSDIGWQSNFQGFHTACFIGFFGSRVFSKPIFYKFFLSSIEFFYFFVCQIIFILIYLIFYSSFIDNAPERCVKDSAAVGSSFSS